ncbi:NAD(P)H-dependent oxidoreductase [Rhizobium sp. Root1220]|uniref:FMN-dependent NADH-azoreductase n=1 Tax=Rhizobium sp. Root1220 TaxID=1736432 RepID=UPI0006FFF486|nr:NAD(P)H-dependent oxidoreductase [Rhizobium sp. Root1220]KQV79598.1 NAD(P)H dehydrogenase [Rhizobium sp. Root1220]
MKVLHVSCSPRRQAAESYRLAQQIIDQLRQTDPGAIVIDRMIGHGIILPIDEDYAVSQGSSKDVSRLGSMAKSEQLILELENADVVVISTPMHNLTLPATLKLWIDHIVRTRRTFNITNVGKVGTLHNRPVYVAISSGGRFSGEHPQQPDFLTPYLKAILGMIGLHKVTTFSVQGTGSHSDALASLRRNADQTVRDYFASLHRDQSHVGSVAY